MENTELAFRMGTLFNRHITDSFWESFKGEYGRVQVGVLVYLFEHPGAQASEIADALNISKQHVSVIVKELVGSSLVEASADSSDKRVRNLSLSGKGQSYLQRHFDVSDSAFNRLLSQMSAQEQQSFTESMKTIVELLEKAYGTHDR